ncbi:hypothetical protein [Helicoverpa assulta nucleopolyhedrovirus]|nr:hypothetical protein [Helicoverpa assulta nucleopolyhedrovirus]
MQSNININGFYNASRIALKSTTLHDGNMPVQQYTSVIQSRNVRPVCYDSNPTSRQKRLKLHKKCHNKENIQ